ncbi:Iron-sulfur cluster assembly protein sufA [Granulibacter bethesdensis]|uniref:Iron-sulfur cluster assembly protein sufA n=2 Tax=Granulibacter bethesdensis TaxID=364410 RepID=Q0BSP2_GRABC|nr:Iron-sulfur cluster assembly protein sufA [Granulibacter bethesdensis CGDNIH1]AHJ68935.1 Iron-sulfur cluster assembly protein sufA [Granulibacter bethesdensis]APH51987.1 Iron-sulfur cluster assembly protein sufA [Granulibacter bethesdensis]APH64677.1 Iron-sulfur cluster assembly protein sufA [Granulibacter bethesdensis]
MQHRWKASCSPGFFAYFHGMDALETSPDISSSGSAVGFGVSASAAARIAEIAQGQALRVSVLAGGCSGFQYQFALDGQRADDDVVIERDGAVVLVDPASLEFLAGAELDYKDALMGSHFTIRNPNATASCGCGTSFSVE